MKRIFTAIALTAAVMTGCNYDDSDLWGKVNDLDSRLESLEKRVERLNDEIISIQTVVAALDGGWKVTEMKTDDQMYTVIFANGRSVEIAIGNSDPEVAALGVFSEGDVWYWCINAAGETTPLKDDNGANVSVESGRVGVDAAGYWTLNNGTGAVRIVDGAGFPISVSGEKRESLFAGVEQTDDEVIFVLADGTKLHVAKSQEKNTVNFTFAEGLSYELRSGETRVVVFAASCKKGVRLTASSVAGGGWKSSVKITPAESGYDGTLTLTAPDVETNDHATVFLSDNEGGVWMTVVDVSCTSVVDLNAAGTSNCYLVSAPGKYSFDATVRGNGVGEESATGFTPQIELTDGMSADWIWTDKAGLISEVSLNKAGRIEFTLGVGVGNTLVALVKNNAVVWSWHIWATDEPQTMAYENGVMFMDRNLGAVGTTIGGVDAYGMYYQWGRKDPFYWGAATETSAEAFLQAKNKTVINAAFASEMWKYSAVATTPAEAAAHPMTFYNKAVGAGYDWVAAPKKNLWSTDKNLNDPCPVGYKVPTVEAWENLSAGHDYIDGVSAWDVTNYGVTYTSNGQTAWYPGQGYRNYSSGAIVGQRASSGGSGGYWSSKATATKAYYLFIKKQISVAGSINPDLDMNRSYGYNVRCCKE